MMERHELSAMFPAMPDEEFDALAKDIAANGLIEAIVTYQGKVLDGWHRYKACEREGVEPEYFALPEADNPADYVLSRNAHRRHLTAAQRAAVTVQVRKWTPQGRPEQTVEGDEFVDEGPDYAARTYTDAELAEEAGVSVRTIRETKRRVREGHGDALAAGTETIRSLRKKESRDDPLTPMEKLRAQNRELMKRVKELEIALDRADPPASEEAVIEENRALHERINSLTSQLEEARRTAAYWKERAVGG